MKRSAGSLAKQLEIAGFSVFRWTCTTDEKKAGAFAFLLESLALPEYAMRKGPEVSRTKDTDSFVAAARPLAMWVDREMRVSTVVKRKETDAGMLVKALLKKPEQAGVAKDMITGKLKIYSGSAKRLSGLVKGAVDELASTESFFR
jgi:tRNA nucleotidyltransferase (CCA-adding enzyme)